MDVDDRGAENCREHLLNSTGPILTRVNQLSNLLEGFISREK